MQLRYYHFVCWSQELAADVAVALAADAVEVVLLSAG